MTTMKMALSLLNQAKIVLKEAENLNAMGAWNLVVRRCQEVVELALKSALIWAGIQPPRLHDVGPALEKHIRCFPEEFAEHIPQMASISASLEETRGKVSMVMKGEAFRQKRSSKQVMRRGRFRKPNLSWSNVRNCSEAMSDGFAHQAN